jgi:hypothetical protein
MYFRLWIVGVLTIASIVGVKVHEHNTVRFDRLRDQLNRLEITTEQKRIAEKVSDETTVVMTRIFETEKEPSQEALCRLIAPYQRIFGRRFSACDTCRHIDTPPPPAK